MRGPRGARAPGALPLALLGVAAAFREAVAIGALELSADDDADAIDAVQFVEPEEEEQLLDALRTCGACAAGSQVPNTSADGFVRLGDEHQGGYVMCGSALQNASLAFSVGLTGDDLWGQQVSERLGVPVHQFDCTRRAPRANATKAHFHPVCVEARFEDPAQRAEERKAADEQETRRSRFWSALAWVGSELLALTPLAPKEVAPFELLVERALGRRAEATAEGQSVPEYDTNLVLKMDVGGAEWGVLFGSQDAFFLRFRQIVLVLHRLDEPRHYRVYAHGLKKLLANFVVVHTHGDNSAAVASVALPGHGRNFTLPASLEVTLVRRDLAAETPCSSGRRVREDRANVPSRADPAPFLPDDEASAKAAAAEKKEAAKTAAAEKKEAATEALVAAEAAVRGTVRVAKSNATADASANATKAQAIVAGRAAAQGSVSANPVVQAIAAAAAAAAVQASTVPAPAAPSAALEKVPTTTPPPAAEPLVEAPPASLVEQVPATEAPLLTFGAWRGPDVSMKALADRWHHREDAEHEEEAQEREVAGERTAEGLAAITVDPFATQLRSDALPPTFGLSVPPGVDFAPANYAPVDFAADFAGTDVGSFG